MTTDNPNARAQRREGATLPRGTVGFYTSHSPRLRGEGRGEGFFKCDDDCRGAAVTATLLRHRRGEREKQYPDSCTKRRGGSDRRFASLCLCVLAFSWSSIAAAAPPKLTSIFPAGAQRGQTITVTASGSLDPWPVKAWVDRPGVQVTATDEQGKLAVTVADDAAPGLYWVRIHNNEGATAPRPFIVGNLPEVAESEPNDEPTKPHVLGSSVLVVNGQLSKAGDVDGFAVPLRKGQTLVASMVANRTLGSPMDASLQIVSPRGFVLEQNDDYHDLDPQIVFAAPADGNYVVRTFAFPATPDSSIRFAGAAEYIYRLTLTTGGFAEYAYPLSMTNPADRTDATVPLAVDLVGWNIPDMLRECPVSTLRPAADVPTATSTAAPPAGFVASHPDVANPQFVPFTPYAARVDAEPNDREHGQRVELPVVISGRIDQPRDSDWFRFTAKKDERFLFRVESRQLGFPLDPLVMVADASGKVLAENDDSGNGRDAELIHTAAADGEYLIGIRDLHGHGGERYVYRLTAAAPPSDFALKVAADAFVLAPGKPLEITVTIDRLNGYSAEVELAAFARGGRVRRS
jgi:hypothetical protein